MAFERDLIEQLVPPGEAPEIRAIVRERSASLEDSAIRGAYLWASAICDTVLESGVDLPARMVHLSAGFVEIDTVILHSIIRTRLSRRISLANAAFGEREKARS